MLMVSYLLKVLAIILLSIIITTLSMGQSNGYLTVKDVVDFTLQNNKDIAISNYRISEVKGDIQISNAKFNSKFLLQANKEYITTPNTLDQRENLFGHGTSLFTKSDISRLSFELNKKFKFGTEITPGFSLNNYGKDSLYQWLKNSSNKGLYTNRSNLYLNINQPLLLGLGKDFNTYEERIALKEFKISELSHYHTLAYKIHQSLTSYLYYIYANKNLEVQLETQKWYETLLVQIRYLVEMDALPSGDLKYVNAIIASQNAIKQESEYTLQSNERNLAITIGLSTNQLAKLQFPPKDFMIENIQPIDTLGYLSKCINESLLKRNDIAAANYRVEKSDLSINYAKKSIKQELNLKLGIGYNGIFESAGVEQVYQPFIQNIPGATYQVGLTLTINPRHDREKGELVKSLVRKEIEEAKKVQLVSEMNSSIDNCLKRIMAYNQIVAMYKTAVNYNKEALDNEYIKLKLGTSTIINLIQLQINYNEALTDLYSAKLNLNVSLIDFRFLTGTLVNIGSESTIEIDNNNLFLLPYLN